MPIPNIWGPGAVQFAPRVTQRDVLSNLGFIDLRYRGMQGGGFDNSAVLANLTPGQQYLLPPGSWFLGAANVTLPESVGIWYAQGAQLDIDAGTMFEQRGPVTSARQNHIFGGSGGVTLPNEGDLFGGWFGAVGDGDAAKATANSAALNRAVVAAQASRNANVVTGPGIFTLNSTVVISTASNGGVTVIGHRDQALQQGSSYPVTVLRWVGGAAPMFRADETYCSFYHFAVENWGTATDVLEVTSDGAGRIHFYRVCGSMAGASVPFSRAIVTCGYSNYDRYERCEFVGNAPIFLNMDAGGAVHGTTTVQIEKCVFDCILTQPAPVGFAVVKLTNVNVESLQIFGNTFNNQSGGGGTCVVDCSAIGAGTLIDLVYRDNEYDGDVSMAGTSKVLKLKNTKNAMLEGANTFFGGGGAMTSLFTLENSNLNLYGLNAASVNGWLIDVADTVSRVYPGFCVLDVNTRGILNNAAYSARVTDLTLVGTSARILGHRGHPGEISAFRFVVATTAVGYTVQRVDHTGSPPDGWGFLTPGQVIKLEIKNTSAGAINVAFDAAQFKMGAVVLPAAGFRKFYFFEFDGTWLVECAARSGDVPN